jgi:glycosyltransferase involved in cell wall biosynthesis
MSSLSSKQTVYKQPLVSICIPLYNSEKTIVSTIQSIINQTYQNLEIIIVDNASTDNTLHLVGKFNDSRITIYKNSMNIGAEKNFDKCIELATGDYIAIYHSDDLYEPEIVQKQVQAFQHNPSIGAVFTMADHINENNQVVGEFELPRELKNREIYYFSEIFTSILKNGNFLVCPSAIAKSEIYKELIPFNSEKFGSSADLDMWLRILERRPISILNKKLMSYRISSTQGKYVYNYLRTDEADFFKVIDYYLSDRTHTMNVPLGALNNYEFRRYTDNVIRAINYIEKGHSENAKKLLQHSLSLMVFNVAIKRIEKPKLLIFLVFSVILLITIHLGFERYPSKIFRRFQ